MTPSPLITHAPELAGQPLSVKLAALAHALGDDPRLGPIERQEMRLTVLLFKREAKRMERALAAVDAADEGLRRVGAV